MSWKGRKWTSLKDGSKNCGKKKNYGDIRSSLREIYNTANNLFKKCVPVFHK